MEFQSLPAHLIVVSSFVVHFEQNDEKIPGKIEEIHGSPDMIYHTWQRCGNDAAKPEQIEADPARTKSTKQHWPQSKSRHVCHLFEPDFKQTMNWQRSKRFLPKRDVNIQLLLRDKVEICKKAAKQSSIHAGN